MRGLMSAQWNPSPPHSNPPPTTASLAEGESGRDNIGSTVISKAWALSVLVRAVESVSRQASRDSSHSCSEERTTCMPDPQESLDAEPSSEKELISGRDATQCMGGGEDKGAPDGGGGGGGGGGKEGKNDVEELEESLEEDLCQLWDASMNSDVTSFLHEQKAVDLLMGVVSRSNAPRLTEICVGVLGNMACEPGVCSHGFSSTEIVKQTLSFLCDSDTKILYETTRLISTCISNGDVQSTWLAEIRESQTARQSLIFIMQSSSNEELLKSTAGLMDTLLDSDEQLLEQWSDCELVDSLCEAVQQTTTSALDGAGSYVMCLQLLSTTEKGVASLVQRADTVTSVLLKFLNCLSCTEAYLEERWSPLYAALSLLNTLTQNTSQRQLDGSQLSGERAQDLLRGLQEDLQRSDSEKREVQEGITRLVDALILRPRPVK